MGDQAANQSNGAAGAPAQGAQQGGGQQQGGETGPGPVPYAVFAEANRKLREAESQRDAFATQLETYGPTKVQDLETRLNATREEMSLRVALARAGVHSDAGLDYLVHRYRSFEQGRAPVDEYIGQLKSTEPAFFGVAPAPAQGTGAQAATPAAGGAGAPASGSPASTPARTSPDVSTKGPTVSGQDPPLSEELIRNMDQATFERRYAEIEAFLRTRKRK